MFQCLFCPNSSTSFEPTKAPFLEIVCEDDDDIPDIRKSNSTSTEETICSASTGGEDESHIAMLHDKDSLDVAMRTSTPSNHLLEIFLSSPRVEQVLSWISPKSATSEEEEDETAAPSSAVHLGNSPVLSSPSLNVKAAESSSPDVISLQSSSLGNEDNDQQEQQQDSIRQRRIQQELNDILKFASDGVFIEDEATEALGIAANQVLAFGESIGQAILVNHHDGNHHTSILQVAEDHYFGDSNSFVTRYAAVLRSTVRQMKSNSLQDQKYYHGPDFQYVRLLEEEQQYEKSSSSSSSRLKTLAQTVAWGSWKSAGWVYKQMVSISPPPSP